MSSFSVLHFHPCHSWVTVQWSFPFSVHWAHLKSKQFLAVSSPVCDFHSVYFSLQNLPCHLSSSELSVPKTFISLPLFCSHPWLLIPVHELAIERVPAVCWAAILLFWVGLLLKLSPGLEWSWLLVFTTLAVPPKSALLLYNQFCSCMDFT